MSPAPANACPSRDQLTQLALGKLPLTDIDKISQHVQHCPTCQELLATVDHLEDSFVRDFKQTIVLPAVRPDLERQLQAAEEISRVVWDSPADVLPDDPLPRLLGQYELLERIGQGGMGVVYKARHTKLNRLVAVKLLPAGRLQDAGAVERFHHEMQAVAALDHPNIVRAHDANTLNGEHFLVMEYVDGADLSRRVRQSGPLPVREACDLIRQAAVGLQHAHEHGLIHRDVKPSNLMWTLQGQVKLLDLGLARVLTGETDTATGSVVGTAAYMAPEQANDARNADARSDIFSLGWTLIFLLTGHARRETPADRVETGKPCRLADLPATIPAALTRVIERMIDPDPAQAYPSAAAVAAALEPLSGNARPRRFLRWLALLAVGVVAAVPLLLGPVARRTTDGPPAQPVPSSVVADASTRSGEHAEFRDSAAVFKLPTGKTAPGEQVFTGHTAPVVGVGFSRDGQQVFSADRSGTIRVWDMNGSSQRVWEAKPVELTTAAAFASTRDGPVALLGGEDVTTRLVSVETGKLIHRLVEGGRSKPDRKERRPILSLAISADGRRALTESEEGGLCVWNLVEGKEGKPLRVDSYHAAALAWFPDGRHAVYATRNSLLQVVDVDANKELFPLRLDGTYALALAVSPDSRFVAGTLMTGEVCVWNLKTRSVVSRLQGGHVFPPVCVAFTPDSRRLVSASGADQAVCVWDVANGKRLQRWQTSHGPIICLAISGDGLRVACGSKDHSICVWQLPP